MSGRRLCDRFNMASFQDTKTIPKQSEKRLSLP